MTKLDHQFHRAQQRIKSRSVGSMSESRPLFQPELATLDAKSNRQRFLDYEAKWKAMERVA